MVSAILSAMHRQEINKQNFTEQSKAGDYQGTTR